MWRRVEVINFFDFWVFIDVGVFFINIISSSKVSKSSRIISLRLQKMFSKTYFFPLGHRSSTLGTLRCNWFFNLYFFRFSSFYLILQIKISFKNFLLEFGRVQICNVRSREKYPARLIKLSRFNVFIFNSEKLNSFCFIQFLTIVSQDLFFVWVVSCQNLLIYCLFSLIIRVNFFSKS